MCISADIYEDMAMANPHKKIFTIITIINMEVFIMYNEHYFVIISVVKVRLRWELWKGGESWGSRDYRRKA